MNSARTRTIRIDPSDDISKIESQIAKKTDIAKGAFYLLAGGKILRPGLSAADYGVTKHATLFMHARAWPVGQQAAQNAQQAAEAVEARKIQIFLQGISNRTGNIGKLLHVLHATPEDSWVIGHHKSTCGQDPGDTH